MKSIYQVLNEARLNEEKTLPSHKSVLSAISKAFESHRNGNTDYDTLHLRSNVSTGASKHSVGSVKAHSLAYKANPNGNAFTGKAKYDPSKKYASHPMKKTASDLAKKFGGHEMSDGAMIKTKEGITHHIRNVAGSAHSTWDHSYNN